MKKTFVCDESVIITIPLGSLMDARDGQLMPDKFQCVYRDSYKVFVVNGKPKPLGVSWTVSFTGQVIHRPFHSFMLIFPLSLFSFWPLGSPSRCWRVHSHSGSDFLSDRIHPTHHQDLHFTQCCGKYSCDTSVKNLIKEIQKNTITNQFFMHFHYNLIVSSILLLLCNIQRYISVYNHSYDISIS